MIPGQPDVRIFTSAPVATGSIVWQSRGQLYVSIAVKATFALVHDQPMELVEPIEMYRAELHHRDNPSRSVRATSDLVPYLNRADVVLTGHACAPAGETATMVAVRFAVYREGPILDKAAHVYGDRKKGAVVPFDKMPLVYERAIGGVGWDDNPLGLGMRAGGPSDPTAANIVHPKDPTILTGFGPISRTWPARRRLLGKADRKALDKPIAAVPDGFDWAYFQAAPPDQQIDFPRGDEWIVLEGMHPHMPRIASRLPNARATGTVGGLAPGPPRPLDLRADIVRVDADAQSCSVVWRSVCPVRDEATIDAIRFTVGIELAGHSIEWSDAVSIADEDVIEAPPSITIDELDLSEDALTLKRGDKRPEKTTLWTPEMAAELRRPPPELAGKFEGTYALSQDDQGRAAERAAIPFEKPPAPARPPGAKHERTMALSPEEEARAAITPETPFGKAQPPRPRAVVARPLPGAPWAGPAAPAPSTRKPATSALNEETLDSEQDAEPVPSKPLVPLRQRVSVSAEPPASVRGAMPPSFRAPLPPSTRAPPLPAPSVAPPAPSAPAAPAAPPPGASRPPPPPLRPPTRAVTAIKAQEHVPRRPQDAVPIAHQTPFVAFTMPWQLKPGADSLTVIIKATCSLVPDGPAALYPEAEPPSGDRHDGDDPSRTVLYPSDFVPFKPRADVVLSGHAYAPRGSSPAAQARFRFGSRTNSFDRRVAVFGERRWDKIGLKLAPAAPRRFKKVPLVYERAFGGPAFDKNPSGMGQIGDALPQLEDPSRLLESPNDTPDPACFAAVPAAWPGRRSKLGTFDAEWKKSRWPYFPADFDWAFFQAAPPAQQLEHLQGDEPFELTGVSAEHPSISGKLPGVRPRCFAQRTSDAGGEFHEVKLRLDTVTFEPDRMLVTLVWRGAIDVQGDDAVDVAQLFVLEDSALGPEIDRTEAYSKCRALTLPRNTDPLGDDDPANQIKPPTPELPAAALREDRLAAAGFSAKIADPDDARPPLETIDLDDEDLLPPASVEARQNEQAAALRAQVSAMLASGGSFNDIDLSGAELGGMDFSRRSLAGATLTGAKLTAAKLAGADLTGAQLGGADLTNADLSGADLTSADLTGADLTGADLTGAKIGDATFTRARADGSKWNDARGDLAVLAGASLRRARFERAAMKAADLTRAELDLAVFDGAVMPEIRLYDAKGTGVSFKGATLDGARADGVTLRKSTLAKASAPSSVWDKAVLDDTSFHGAVMPESGFVKASCKGAVFSGAELSGARLRKGVFTGAAFLKTNLMGATLEGADLTGADLRGANLHGAETHRAKLAGIKLDLAIVTQTKLAERP